MFRGIIVVVNEHSIIIISSCALARCQYEHSIIIINSCALARCQYSYSYYILDSNLMLRGISPTHINAEYLVALMCACIRLLPRREINTNNQQLCPGALPI